MGYLAAIEVDKRQKIILAADKMKEMLGGSWTIADTKTVAEKILQQCPRVNHIKIASGEIWVRSDDLKALEDCLWAFREEIVNNFGLPCSFAVIVEEDDLQATGKRLNDLMTEVKNRKCGETGNLSLPWFAPCQIQPSESANHWIPAWADHDQHKRRSLISESSLNRLKRGFSTLDNYYNRFKEIIEATGLKLPESQPKSLNDFASSEEGSYLALLRFDADKSSDFFKAIHLPNEDGKPCWWPLTKCSVAFGAYLDMALKTAFEETIRPLKFKNSDKIPISPLISEGEDFLIVLRKDLALPFTFQLLKTYSELANSDRSHLKQAASAFQNADDKPFVFSLSGTVVFARSGYPFSVLSELSTDLEHSAKNHRASLLTPQPCLDVYWLESTAREDPIIERRNSLTYQLEGIFYSLNTRPWTLTETEAMWKAAANLNVPRGKRHQLLAGLRSGEPLASFHFQRWMQHLSFDQRNTVSEATKKLEEAGLWDPRTEPWITRSIDGTKYQCCPLLELHELCEIVGSVEEPDA